MASRDAAFEDQFRIVLFDYVNSGGSDLDAYGPERYSLLDGGVDDIFDICHTLDLEDVILVGHSVSSMIAMLAANREPERFDRLIPIGSSPATSTTRPYVQRQLAGSTLRRLKATGHCLPMSHPPESNEAIPEFLRPTGAGRDA